MSNVVKLPRKPRPLKATYDPSAPYVIERQDAEHGDINYEVVDERPESYRVVCQTLDGPYGKHDAEQIVRALNLMVQYGKENLPEVRDHEGDAWEDEEE